MYFYQGKDFQHPRTSQVPGKTGEIYITKVVITLDTAGDRQFSLMSIRVNTVKIPSLF